MRNDNCAAAGKGAETPQQFLERVFCEIPHFEGMFLLDPQNKMLAQAANEDQVLTVLAGLTPELLTLAKRTAVATRQDRTQFLLLKNAKGYIMIMPLDKDYVFVALGSEHLRPDVIRYSAGWIASKLLPLLP